MVSKVSTSSNRQLICKKKVLENIQMYKICGPKSFHLPKHLSNEKEEKLKIEVPFKYRFKGFCLLKQTFVLSNLRPNIYSLCQMYDNFNSDLRFVKPLQQEIKLIQTKKISKIPTPHRDSGIIKLICFFQSLHPFKQKFNCQSFQCH